MNNRGKPNKPRMLAVRASRETCLAFYNNFTEFEVDYVAASEKEFIPSIGKIADNINIISPGFYPSWGIDPVTLLQKRISNLSWSNIEGLEELVKKSDVVNLTDTYYFFNKQAALLAKKYHKPVVTVIWTTIPSHLSVWLPPYSWNVRAVLDVTDLFILRCRTAYKFTDSLGIDRHKTQMIYKGVDLQNFYPNLKKQKDKKQVDILFVGNYHRSKGILELIEAFEGLLDDKLPVRLIMAGRGELTNYVNQKARNIPIINHDFISYDKLGDVYRQGDIFCSPSKTIEFMGVEIWEEYFSYTLMEAQASGLPIVATKSGGIPEEVGGQNPLVEIGDANGLYTALKVLVLDKVRREALSKLNRERAELLFDAKKQAKATEDAILKFLAVRKHK